MGEHKSPYLLTYLLTYLLIYTAVILLFVLACKPHRSVSSVERSHYEQQ